MPTNQKSLSKLPPPGGAMKLDLSKNQFLAALPSRESKRLLPHLESVSLKLNFVLYRSGDAALYVYFPQDGIVSLLAPFADGKSVEVSLVGSEGLVGICAALGAKKYRYEGLVQAPSTVLRIKADVFRAELSDDGSLRDSLDRYILYLLAQVAQTAACNRVHKLELRLARWLLMIQDRVKKNVFPATHEALSYMLGADRSEVTIAAGTLRNAGCISYRHGKMTILDRNELESIACDCYRILTRDLKEYSPMGIK